ncbi:MAG: hybrid sensor histidine kinase/response regulator [Isosphaeraceae bacterium]
MDKAKLITRLMNTFLDELQEHVRALNRESLALEKNPAEAERARRLQELLRTAHSLKGAAHSVDLSLIEQACHGLEDLLAGVRDNRVAFDSELFSLLFAMADSLEEAQMRLREQRDLADSPLGALLPRLEAAVGIPALWPFEPAPRPLDAGVPLAGRDAGEMPAPQPPAAQEAGAPPPVRSTPPAEHSESGGVVRPGDGPPEPSVQPSGASRQPPPAALAQLPRAAIAGFVRVPAEKLDALLTYSGELLVARRRVESRTSELEAIREFLGRWKTERRRCDRALRTLKRAENSGRSGLPSMAGTGDGKLLPRPAAVVLGQIDDNLRRLEKDLERFAMVLTSDGRQLDQVADLLDDAVRRLRMLPFAEACQGLDRLVRDLARASGKEVVLLVEGGQVELDRSILEGLRDPLYHLVRNAVDHGIETPDQRQAAGKLAQGRITLAAALRGTQVEVVVADDGRGLDLEAVRQQVRQQGLGEPPDERDLASCIFLPGFSTASLITSVSGRGVGLDVVKSQVELLHGTIDLSFTAGQGTRFALAVPLTLTTLRALLVEAGEQTFAWASTNVQRLVRIGPDDIRMVGGREMLVNGKSLLPMASLAETLGLPATTAAGAGGKRPGLIVAAAERRMVFVVDELIAEQEIVVKGLGDRIRRVRNFSGATILPSGRIALVLNAAALIRAAMSQSVGPTPAPVPAMTGSLARKRLLVVDDSVTTRSLEKSILEAAGYEVVTAADGEAGWKLLQERDVDLVITDIEMPRMDGFELTEAIRRSKRSHQLPVILISARSSDRDKARGIEVGADAYIVKSTFDQKELLEALGQLL